VDEENNTKLVTTGTVCINANSIIAFAVALRILFKDG
jgi:hypothetical protein